MKDSEERGNGRKGARNWTGLKGIIILIILILMVVGYYFYLSNRKQETKSEQTAATKVQDALLKDLERSYPPTPKEVVKYYSEITMCFYGEDYSEEEFKELGLQIRKLYDEDLLANNPEDIYFRELQSDVKEWKEKKCVVSNFATSSSTDVEYFTEDGDHWAKLYCSYRLRQGTQVMTTNEQFLLRQDGEGHWKIYGWTLAE